MGQKTYRVGNEPRHANIAKIAGNLMVACAIEAIAEAAALLRKYRMSAPDVLDVIITSLFNVPVYQGYGRAIAHQQYVPPGFDLVLGMKDVGGSRSRRASRRTCRCRSRACCAMPSSTPSPTATPTRTGRRSPASPRARPASRTSHDRNTVSKTPPIFSGSETDVRDHDGSTLVHRGRTGARRRHRRSGTAGAADPIKIGFSMPLTGGLASNGKAILAAYQMWEEDINAKGGILGRPVKLIYYDDHSNPSLVPAIYAKLFDVDKIDLAFTSYGTNLSVPSMPVVIRATTCCWGCSRSP